MNKKHVLILLFTSLISSYSNSQVLKTDNCCPQPRPLCCEAPICQSGQQICRPRRTWRPFNNNCCPTQRICRPKRMCCQRWRCCRPKKCCPVAPPVCPPRPCIQTQPVCEPAQATCECPNNNQSLPEKNITNNIQSRRNRAESAEIDPFADNTPENSDEFSEVNNLENQSLNY